MRKALLPLAFLALLFAVAVFDAKPWRNTDWRAAPRDSAHLAPTPSEEPRAVVQGYAARAIRWRGVFGVHSWISVKEKEADHYRVYQLMGWRLRRTGNAVSIERDLPDRSWFGREPELLFDLRGPEAERLIPLLHEKALAYPHQKNYRVWPGPNSNSFVSYLLRETGIGVELPPHAVGRDRLAEGGFFGRSETGTGFQFSLFGLLGATAGLKDGLEVNLLGLCFGVDVLRPALKLPLVGRVGMKDGV